MAWGNVNVGQKDIDASGYVSSELMGTAGGIATLNSEGKLTESQRPDIDAYTKAETESKISEAVSTHNTNTEAHSDIRATLSSLQTKIKTLEMKFSDVTDNAFTVDFDTLDDATVTGVWNEPQARVEF